MLRKCHIQRDVSSCCYARWIVVCLVTCLLVSTVNSKANLENDAFLDTVGLIRKHQYPVEQYPLLTKDGFLLSLVRIPLSRGIPRTFKTKPGPPILLVHGIISSADDWVLNSPWNSPGFLLSDAGYDVWLINTRGTPYSKHLKHHRNSKQFWDFSFDEIGVFDVPAAIDFVLDRTGHPQLTIMGWSQGTTDIMVTLSLKPQYNHKVKLFVALAPVGNITHLASPMTMLIPFKGIIKKTVDIFNGGGVFPSSRHSRSMYNHLCNSHIRGLCFLPVSVSVGISAHQLNKTRIPVYMAHMPSGTSTKNLVHFVQNRHRKDFRRYDYGEQENIWRYGTPFPPKYPLYKISTPMAIFWGKGDRLATPEDVSTLRRELSHTIIYDYLVPEPEFAHLDFTIGINAKEVLHDPVLHVINDFNKGLHLGLYRPELHDTLFESPVPPFPMPPMTHKNPSGLPIMAIKVASIAMDKPWHEPHDVSAGTHPSPPLPLPPSSLLEEFRPPHLGSPSLQFSGNAFTHLGDITQQNIPKPLSFGHHHGFGSSPSQRVFNRPMFIPQVSEDLPRFPYEGGDSHNSINEISVNSLNELKPPPVRDARPPSDLPDFVLDDSQHSQLHGQKSLGTFHHLMKSKNNPVVVSKPLPASGHFVDFDLDRKPVAMHPDSNGGFQTDWFPVRGGSKKLKLQDLMPSTSERLTSSQVPLSSKPVAEKSTSARIRGPHQTPWRVM